MGGRNAGANVGQDGWRSRSLEDRGVLARHPRLAKSALCSASLCPVHLVELSLPGGSPWLRRLKPRQSSRRSKTYDRHSSCYATSRQGLPKSFALDLPRLDVRKG